MAKPCILPVINDPDRYQSFLDFEKMPRGLTPGAYARVVLESMRKDRVLEMYGRKESIHPTVAWSAIVNDAQLYGLTNAWLDDGHEDVMRALLDGGADCSTRGNYWSSDLTEWPFRNRNLLGAWCRTVGNQLFFKKIETHASKYSSSSTSPYTYDNLALCGMWLMSQKDVLGDLPKVWSDVYRYVEFIQNMDEFAFSEKIQKQGWNEVIYPNHKYTKLHRAVEKAPVGYAWVDSAFAPLALGMSWQISEQRNDHTFERVVKLLDSSFRITPRPILRKMYEQTENIQQKMVELAQLMDKASQEIEPSKWFQRSPPTGWGIIEPVYSTPSDLNLRPIVVKTLMTLSAQVKQTFMRQALWAGVTSCASNSYFNTAHSDKLIQWMPVFQTLDFDTRKQMVQELVLAISRIQNISDKMTPWERWANFMEGHSMDADDLGWAVQTGQWLSQWLPEYSKDIQIILTVTDDVSTFGQLFTDTLRRGEFNMEQFEASPNLDGLFE